MENKKIRLLLPCQKTKVKKSCIRGYWLDDDKIYYDYITSLERDTLTKRQAQKICNKTKELALFYINRKNNACIYDSRTGKIDILENSRTIIHNGYRGLKNVIKRALYQYNGITVYVKGNRYNIKVYYK